MMDISLLLKALESIREGIAIADAQQQDMPLIYVNAAFEAITGYSKEDVLGKNCRFLQGENTDQFARTQIREALQQGTSCKVLLANFRKDGQLFWNELSLGPVVNQDGVITHYVGIQSDVTERVKAQESLQASLENSEKVAELRAQMLRVISHEFKTPLTSILFAVGFLKDYRNILTEQQLEEQIENIAIAIEQINGHIEQATLASKITSGTLIVQEEEISFLEFLYEQIAYLSYSLQINSQKIHIFTDNNISRSWKVKTDPSLLRLIIQNIVSNAVKYSQHTDKPVEITVLQAEDVIEMNIRDYGVGIPQVDLAHIFQSFHRGKNVHTIRGTGLGLSIVHYATKLLGIQLEVESQEGEYTLFSLKIKF